MFNAAHDIAFCRMVGPELVGDHRAWRTALPFQELGDRMPAALPIRGGLFPMLAGASARLLDSYGQSRHRSQRSKSIRLGEG
jgi:hypothetical protein